MVYSPYRDVGGTRHKETTFPCLYQQFIPTPDKGCQPGMANNLAEFFNIPEIELFKENFILIIILVFISINL